MPITSPSSRLLPFLFLILTGCGMTSNSGAPQVPVSPLATTLQGRVQGGQQPVSGASIQLYAVATTGDGAPATPLLTSAVTTDAGGRFNITSLYPCSPTSTLVYITATGGNPGLPPPVNSPAIAGMTALGPCGALTPSSNILIDERTTVAAVWALAPFMTSLSAIGSSTIDAPGLASAFTYANSLVNSANGNIPGPSLPLGATAPVTQINTLANILAACLNSAGGVAGDGSACGKLFSYATPSGASAPTNVVDAALNLARDPLRNVASFYNLISPNVPFQPELSGAPADWTIALSGNAPAANPLGCTQMLSGTASFTDFTMEQPGVCRTLHAADLPAPYATNSANNGSTQVARQAGQMPIVPPGFKVTLYATGLNNPRFLLTAPNGDLFVGEPGAGSILVLRGVNSTGQVVTRSTFASNLPSPYGLAFYPAGPAPQFLYFANTPSIERFPYTSGDLTASAAATTLATDLPNGGNHTTRTLAFTSESTPRLLVSVGSASNVTNTDTTSSEFHRANILAYSSAGVFQSVFASGLRNPVGLTLDSAGTVWTSVNERDGLGDNLPSDYVTHVQENGFYGWPWYYNGPYPDPRLPVSHPDLASKTITGDTLLQPHFAPLQIAFYTGQQFPTPYRGDLFVASHGSWNKAIRGGYELLRVRIANGVATGAYEDFLSGFVNPDGTVWGRPAGVAVGTDGAVYVADDASNSIWRIAYIGAQ